MVIMNIGVPVVYQVGVDNPTAPPTNCPMCGDYVNPELCAFNNCEYKFIGTRKLANGKPENFKSEWKEVGPEKGYQRFDKGEEQNYSQLTIETKLLDGSSITQEMEINLDDMSRTDSFSNLSSGYDSTNSLDNIVSLSS